jgi:ribosomal protein S6--L-glutamate ligase
MRRVAKSGEFRSNVHRGGRAELVELDERYQETAVRAAQILGLRVAGVDMLEATEGPQIIEVNSSPGLEGIEGATQLDIAGSIVDYIASQVRFPEIDLRQRLAVSRGHQVAELTIREGSELVGKKISESGLIENDVVILTLTRGTKVIPTPKISRELEAGDRLLGFGRLEAIQHLVSDRKRRKRKLEPRPLETSILDEPPKKP